MSPRGEPQIRDGLAPSHQQVGTKCAQLLAAPWDTRVGPVNPNIPAAEPTNRMASPQAYGSGVLPPSFSVSASMAVPLHSREVPRAPGAPDLPWGSLKPGLAAWLPPTPCLQQDQADARTWLEIAAGLGSCLSFRPSSPLVAWPMAFTIGTQILLQACL